MNDVVLWICGILIFIGSVLAIFRVEKGPSMLDRAVGLDVFTSGVVSALAVLAAAEKNIDLLPILVSIALVGFVGSVAIARFAAVEPGDERRILSEEEALREQLEHELRAQIVIEAERSGHLHEDDDETSEDDFLEEGDADGDDSSSDEDSPLFDDDKDDDVDDAPSHDSQEEVKTDDN